MNHLINYNNMKIRYILKDKKLQKKLNLQSTATDKQMTFYSVSGKTNYKLNYNNNKLYI